MLVCFLLEFCNRILVDMKNIVYFILSQWLEFSAWSSLQYAQCHESSILIGKGTVHRAGYRSVLWHVVIKGWDAWIFTKFCLLPILWGPLKKKFVRATFFLKCQFGTPKIANSAHSSGCGIVISGGYFYQQEEAQWSFRAFRACGKGIWRAAGTIITTHHSPHNGAVNFLRAFGN